MAPLGPVYQGGPSRGTRWRPRPAWPPWASSTDDVTLSWSQGRPPGLRSGTRPSVRRTWRFRCHTPDPLVGIFFTDERVRHYDDAKAAADNGLYKQFFHAMLDQGIALAPGPYEALFPSMAHSDGDIDRTIEAAGNAARSLQAA